LLQPPVQVVPTRENAAHHISLNKYRLISPLPEVGSFARLPTIYRPSTAQASFSPDPAMFRWCSNAALDVLIELQRPTSIAAAER
jgi:hypothetical protein